MIFTNREELAKRLKKIGLRQHSSQVINLPPIYAEEVYTHYKELVGLQSGEPDVDILLLVREKDFSLFMPYHCFNLFLLGQVVGMLRQKYNLPLTPLQSGKNFCYYGKI